MFKSVLVSGCIFSTVFGKSLQGCEEPPDRVEDDILHLTLLHVNDIHSHFEEVNVNTGTCKDDMKSRRECYGGVSRMAGYIQQVRDADPEAILLNAGDYYQGTMWYTIFKYEPVVEFSNLLNYTAMALGNHDFDDGSEGLQPFVERVNYPVLAANLNTSVLAGIEKSVVVMVKGRKVGIIGYVTQDTGTISQPGKGNAFLDVIESVREEAKRLTSLGINIIIATGHAGYNPVDLRMAEEIKELDIVVGGHSHTFLYTGHPPSVEKPKGPYPTYVTQASGRVVPVVQAYCYTKYLGHLEIVFDNAGELVEPVPGGGVTFAEPVLLDSTHPQLGWVESKLERYQEKLQSYREVVGYSAVRLFREDNAESSLGDMVTDSMAAAWDDTSIAFINDGGLRTELEKGEITGEDVFGVIPFNNTVDRVVLAGRDIKAVLEWNVAGLCPNQTCDPGEFYQVAGLQVHFHIKAHNQGKRIARIDVQQPDGTFTSLDDDILYPIALTSFLILPGKSPIYDLMKEHQVGPTDYEVLVKYLQDTSPITTRLEGRIAVHYFVEFQHK